MAKLGGGIVDWITFLTIAIIVIAIILDRDNERAYKIKMKEEKKEAK